MYDALRNGETLYLCGMPVTLVRRTKRAVLYRDDEWHVRWADTEDEQVDAVAWRLLTKEQEAARLLTEPPLLTVGVDQLDYAVQVNTLPVQRSAPLYPKGSK